MVTTHDNERLSNDADRPTLRCERCGTTTPVPAWVGRQGMEEAMRAGFVAAHQHCLPREESNVRCVH